MNNLSYQAALSVVKLGGCTIKYVQFYFWNTYAGIEWISRIGLKTPNSLCIIQDKYFPKRLDDHQFITGDNRRQIKRYLNQVHVEVHSPSWVFAIFTVPYVLRVQKTPVSWQMEKVDDGYK